MNLSPTNFPTISAKIMAEKRRADRVEAAFSAAVLLDNQFACHCVVKDVSTSGLKLELEKSTKLPKQFTLKLASLKNPIIVEQQWRYGNFMGVRAIEGSTQGNDFI